VPVELAARDLVGGMADHVLGHVALSLAPTASRTATTAPVVPALLAAALAAVEAWHSVGDDDDGEEALMQVTAVVGTRAACLVGKRHLCRTRRSCVPRLAGHGSTKSLGGLSGPLVDSFHQQINILTKIHSNCQL
jgi:hypothetical protein